MKTSKLGQLAGLLLMVGLPAAQATENVTLYVTDAQGTVVAEMTPQASGPAQVTYQAAYTPYGSKAVLQGTAQAGPGYTGHVDDPDTGLVYMQARYYDPVTARFLSTDPVGPGAGEVFGFNRYDYADDNPIVNTDPTGANCYMGNQSSCEPVTDRPPPLPPPPPPKPEVSPAVQRMRDAADGKADLYQRLMKLRGALHAKLGFAVGLETKTKVLGRSLTVGLAYSEGAKYTPLELKAEPYMAAEAGLDLKLGNNAYGLAAEWSADLSTAPARQEWTPVLGVHPLNSFASKDEIGQETTLVFLRMSWSINVPEAWDAISGK